MSIIFPEVYPWGRQRSLVRPPHAVIHTLSAGRPRWGLQLCKGGALNASKRRSPIISIEDIDASTDEYGQRRISDVVSEHIYECAQVRELITAFYDGPARFKTDELFKRINSRILGHLTPEIDGKGTQKARDIAQFLFRIGFLAARDESERVVVDPTAAAAEDPYKHYTFEEKPSLLQDRTNIDLGMSWEIHPFYRTTLKLT